MNTLDVKFMKERQNDFNDEIVKELVELFLDVPVNVLKRFKKIYNDEFDKFFEYKLNKWVFISLDTFRKQDTDFAVELIKKWLKPYEYITMNDKLVESINNSIITSLLFIIFMPSLKSNQIGKITKINEKGIIIQVYKRKETTNEFSTNSNR